MRYLNAGIYVGILLGLFPCANAQATKTIIMQDACDPDSLNAAVGPGTCAPGHHGTTLFGDFLGELQSDQNAGAWRFNPMVNVTEGNFKLVRQQIRWRVRWSTQRTHGKP